MHIKDHILKFLRNDWHFLLLIIFFITHGYAEFVGLIPLSQLLLLLLLLLAGGLLLAWICRRMFRERRKAHLFTFFFIALFLFFGAFQDLLGRFHFAAAVAQLKIFLPLSLLMILLAWLVLKKITIRSARFIVFLNTLLLVYILVDLATIILSAQKNKQQHSATAVNGCDTCYRPPVYLIVLDEYAGSRTLKEYFRYDNTPMERFLAGEGFHVNQGATSNYLLTIFSMSSTLNMEYLDGIGLQLPNNHYGYRQAISGLGTSKAVQFLQKQGYQVNNYSYFRLPASPPVFKSGYVPGETGLIMHKTMYSRVSDNLVRLLAVKFSIPRFQEQSDAFYISNNDSMMKAALSTATPSARPSFTYLHLMMPHDPIAFDSLGRRIVPFWKRPSYKQKEYEDAYLQYLVYTNRRMQQFITQLKQQTRGEAVIILMSDHGYRKLKNKNLRYQSMNAVYLPKGNYHAWYPGVSNVNQFRILFNTIFNQQFPLLKDSLVLR
jgi:hypothetical protein